MQTDGVIPPLGSLFAEIEQVPTPETARQGIVRRRIPANSPCDLFVGVQKPTNVRVIIACFHAAVLSGVYDLPEFRSLEIAVQRETIDGTEKLAATICAPQAAWNDIFTSLAEDVVRAVASQHDESEAARTFQQRLLQWQTLLQKTGATGLTPEQQQGLFGELWCLREVVLPHTQAEYALRAWLGPDAADQDFMFTGEIALEVKTTHSIEPQTLAISSERQLDETGLNTLYLLHLSIDLGHDTGETLPELIGSVYTVLAANPVAASLFSDKLLIAGYLEVHAARYHDIRYKLRRVRCYLVHNGFPRIAPNNLPVGVGRVRYVISAAACHPFAIDISALTNQIEVPE